MKISKTIKTLAVLSSALAITGQAAIAGPFGFDLDKAPPADQCTPMEALGFFRCTTAPMTHPSFNLYLVQAVEGIGVCAVKGIGKAIETSGHGTQLIHEHDKLKGQISIKYGKPTKNVDILLSGSLWDTPEHYMMGILKNDRNSYAYWKVDPASFDGIEEVYTLARAVSTDSGYVVVEFTTENYGACKEKLDNIEAGAF